MYVIIPVMGGDNMNKKEYPLNPNYIVYDDGRIYSKNVGKFLTPKNNYDGYKRIQIWSNNKCRCIQWHRVIAETFCYKPVGATVVNHINGNKNDNRAINLEWCTQKDNIIHAWKTGLSTSKNHSKYINFTVVDTFTNKTYNYDTLSDIAKNLNGNYFTIRICWKKGSLYKRRYKIKCND